MRAKPLKILSRGARSHIGFLLLLLVDAGILGGAIFLIRAFDAREGALFFIAGLLLLGGLSIISGVFSCAIIGRAAVSRRTLVIHAVCQTVVLAPAYCLAAVFVSLAGWSESCGSDTWTGLLADPPCLHLQALSWLILLVAVGSCFIAWRPVYPMPRSLS
jgi:hypothetical protein